MRGGGGGGGRIISIITYLTLIAFGMIKEGNSKDSRKFDPSYICGIVGCKLPASKFKIEPVSSGSAIYVNRCEKHVPENTIPIKY